MKVFFLREIYGCYVTFAVKKKIRKYQRQLNGRIVPTTLFSPIRTKIAVKLKEFYIFFFESTACDLRVSAIINTFPRGLLKKIL